MNYKELLFNKDKVLSFYPELAVILNKYDEILAEEEFKNGKTNKSGNKRRAGTLGLNEAIIINQISYWNEINKKTGNNFKDGYYWTYNTYEKWSKSDFPYWSADTIRKSITALEEMGVVISTDKYNSYKIDNTKWYRIDYDKLQKIIDTVEEKEKQVSQEENESCDCVNESYIDGLGNYHNTIPDISTETTNRDYDTENTHNSLSSDKDNSKTKVLELHNSPVSEETKQETSVSKTLGRKTHIPKQTPLKDMPTRAREIADRLVDDTETADKVSECISYFLEQYKAYRHKEHIHLTNEKLHDVVVTMLSTITIEHENDGGMFESDYNPLVADNVGTDDMKWVIDEYFKTQFREKTDYSLVYFTQEGVLTNVMNKCMLGGNPWYESHSL